MILKRTNSDDPDFRALVAQLDAYLSEVDGEDHSFYAQYNGLERINHVVVAYDVETAVGCGAFKPYSDASVEIKRMFVEPNHRGRNVGGLILLELETWAREIGYTECILETGHKQKAAVRLYRREGYEVIPNYDQYAGIENSVCMKKVLPQRETATA